MSGNVSYFQPYLNSLKQEPNSFLLILVMLFFFLFLAICIKIVYIPCRRPVFLSHDVSYWSWGRHPYHVMCFYCDFRGKKWQMKWRRNGRLSGDVWVIGKFLRLRLNTEITLTIYISSIRVDRSAYSYVDTMKQGVTGKESE